MVPVNGGRSYTRLLSKMLHTHTLSSFPKNVTCFLITVAHRGICLPFWQFQQYLCTTQQIINKKHSKQCKQVWWWQQLAANWHQLSVRAHGTQGRWDQYKWWNFPFVLSHQCLKKFKISYLLTFHIFRYRMLNLHIFMEVGGILTGGEKSLYKGVRNIRQKSRQGKSYLTFSWMEWWGRLQLQLGNSKKYGAW